MMSLVPESSRKSYCQKNDVSAGVPELCAGARFVAVFLCGGRGTRMRGCTADKILAPLAGAPVLTYPLRAFEAAGIFSGAVFVCRNEAQRAAIAAIAAQCCPALSAHAVFCAGGAERCDSVRNGLEAAARIFAEGRRTGTPADGNNSGDRNAAADGNGNDEKPVFAFIHDSARPLVRAGLLRDLAATALREGAAVAAHRCRNTVKRLPAGACDGSACFAEDLDRARLWETETPQVFPLKEILRAYRAVAAAGTVPTDDVAAAAAAGIAVAFVENLSPNPKLTVPEDFLFCEALLAAETAAETTRKTAETASPGSAPA